jgi:hypothetical protein
MGPVLQRLSNESAHERDVVASYGRACGQYKHAIADRVGDGQRANAKPANQGLGERLVFDLAATQGLEETRSSERIPI